MSGDNSRYQQNSHNIGYGRLKLAKNRVERSVYAKSRSTLKAKSKNMHRFKDYGQSKIESENMALFLCILALF